MESNLGLGMHCINDRNYKSDQNIKDCHNCYFYEQQSDDEVVSNKNIFLVHSKCNIHVGTELSMQYQHIDTSFQKTTPNISNSEVLTDANFFLHKTQTNALSSLL